MLFNPLNVIILLLNDQVRFSQSVLFIILIIFVLYFGFLFKLVFDLPHIVIIYDLEHFNPRPSNILNHVIITLNKFKRHVTFSEINVNKSAGSNFNDSYSLDLYLFMKMWVLLAEYELMLPKL